MRIAVFGTYAADRHPRIGILRDGLRLAGHEVIEINEPLTLSTADRVALVQKPWRGVGAALGVGRLWWRLWRRSRRQVLPDVVVVGYMGQLDIHLASWCFRGAFLVLDQLVSAADTAADRGIGSKAMRALLRKLDSWAVRRADLVLVDTVENETMIPSQASAPVLVVPVGASSEWFRPPQVRPETTPARPLRVVFFGLYTPLQGAPIIGEAIRLLAATDIGFTMIGAGQDLGATRRAAGDAPGVTWIDWVDPQQLPDVVAAHDVCLGIFGTGAKAQRVVPNKVYQAAAAGCAIVTSATAPQQRILGEDAVFVPSGDPAALAGALRRLANDPTRLAELRSGAYERATRQFGAEAVSAPLVRFLAERAP